MIKVGITGGIGSGKTTICHFFELLDIPVFTADTEAKKLMVNSPYIKNKLISILGKDIYFEDQSLDRKKIAKLIFNSPNLLSKINALIHPAVHEEFEKWYVKQNSPYVLFEAAILFECGLYNKMDINILITATEENRINRVISRDNISKEEVKNKIAKQWKEEKKEGYADYIIRNDNRELLIPKLLNLDKKLRNNEFK